MKTSFLVSNVLPLYSIEIDPARHVIGFPSISNTPTPCEMIGAPNETELVAETIAGAKHVRDGMKEQHKRNKKGRRFGLLECQGEGSHWA
jgi:hypothetical protein